MPTGMNRLTRRYFRTSSRVPRAHGDEPLNVCALSPCGRVFPVPTGMNRYSVTNSNTNKSVPRAHGDEPNKGLKRVRQN